MSFIYLKFISSILEDIFKYTLELLCKIVWYIIPIGFCIFLLSFSSKPKSTTTLGNELELEKSTFMYIAPGAMLVLKDGKAGKREFEKFKREWNKVYPFILSFLKFFVYIFVLVCCIIFLKNHGFGE